MCNVCHRLIITCAPRRGDIVFRTFEQYELIVDMDGVYLGSDRVLCELVKYHTFTFETKYKCANCGQYMNVKEISRLRMALCMVAHWLVGPYILNR